MHTLTIRPFAARPSDLSSLTVGELIALAVDVDGVDASTIGEAVARTTLEDLEVLACASTSDDVQMGEDAETATRDRVETRGRALTELARRIREASEGPAA